LYKLHLILKYLRKRRIAWVALLAVTLCTAMVLVVISVMGGWLRMFRESFHGLSGDVVVRVDSLSGFPYYQDIIGELGRLPEVEASAPVLQTFGLININNRKNMGVQVIGYPLDQIIKVNDFQASLYRQYNEPIEEAEKKHLPSDQAKAVRERMKASVPSFNLLPGIDYSTEFKWQSPRASKALVEEARHWPGMIGGIGVFNIRKDETGHLQGRDDYLYRLPIKLTVMGVSATGTFDVGSKAEENYWLVDTSRTKVWQYDSNTVYVPFEILQKDLGMDAQQAEQDGKPITIPARTTEIHVKLQEPWRNSSEGLFAARNKVQQVIDRMMESKEAATKTVLPRPTARTWEQNNAKWLGAIEKEMVLMIFLFGMISVVAVFLIFCIFYMIVAEKTRDIGIIKSVGATSSGVAGIFLGYGATIGLVGAGAGFGIGYLVVHYINQIHTWLGNALHVVVWDPEVYAFDTIPNTMDPVHVSRILIASVLASVLGAVIPAIRAARMNPVEALRWE
jgi:lipoprotein-releasing system permease protein